ncbi:hypothetical protein [Nodularia sp. UHCC 0506]|uniref:hypothetical protein n=1 Tax=Nodularia sp. UHCC 0506 TaxID=3110243 RepID=UPI002B1E9B4B|nr:hypothetical protein [Nodularia sp. UHCC 0506]MEA5514686.1 hypothetical protein [Nodularia sp. UHCC 0506]
MALAIDPTFIGPAGSTNTILNSAKAIFRLLRSLVLTCQLAPENTLSVSLQ